MIISDALSITLSSWLPTSCYELWICNHTSYRFSLWQSNVIRDHLWEASKFWFPGRRRLASLPLSGPFSCSRRRVVRVGLVGYCVLPSSLGCGECVVFPSCMRLRSSSYRGSSESQIIGIVRRWRDVPLPNCMRSNRSDFNRTSLSSPIHSVC